MNVPLFYRNTHNPDGSPKKLTSVQEEVLMTVSGLGVHALDSKQGSTLEDYWQFHQDYARQFPDFSFDDGIYKDLVELIACGLVRVD